MTSLHLGNQFMYHMIISGNCWAFFFNVFFIYSFSPLTAVRRDEDKKWNKNSRSTVEFMFSLIRSRRLDINLGLFIRFYGPRLCLGRWKRNKRTQPIPSHLNLTLGQYHIWIYFLQTHKNLAREDSTRNRCTSEPGICPTYRSVDFLSL